MFDALEEVANNINPEFAPPTTYNTFTDIAGVIVNLVIWVSFGISIIAIAYSMVMYITSAGNPDKTKRAWGAFVWGIVAALVSLSLVVLQAIAFNVITGQSGESMPGLPGLPVVPAQEVSCGDTGTLELCNAAGGCDNGMRCVGYDPERGIYYPQCAVDSDCGSAARR